jgi:hypothetical protein
MLKKPKTEVAGMWINPNSTLSRGHIAWDRRKTDAMNARYLDLAEIALRKKSIKPQQPRDWFAPADNIGNGDFQRVISNNSAAALAGKTQGWVCRIEWGDWPKEFPPLCNSDQLIVAKPYILEEWNWNTKRLLSTAFHAIRLMSNRAAKTVTE